jgi:hypothetical protein
VLVESIEARLAVGEGAHTRREGDAIPVGQAGRGGPGGVGEMIAE